MRPPGAAGGEPGEAGAPGGGAAEELAQRQGPAQVQVGVVFPGEADAAEDLDAVLGVVHRVVQRQRGGGRGGERVLVGCVVGGAGGVPGQGGGTLGPAGHGGAEVLDRLERADRAAELAADPGVAGRRGAAPGGHPGGFGGEQGGSQVADALGGQVEGPVREDAVEPDGGQVAGEVDRGELGDGDARPVLAEEEPGVTVGAWRPGRARGRRPTGPGRSRRSPAENRASEPVSVPGVSATVAGCAGQEAGERGGQDRAGGQGAGQFLQRGGQVGRPCHPARWRRRPGRPGRS